jgi:uncharacterized iron-regulated membrane protein
LKKLRFRTLLRQIHLWLGLISGTVVFIVALCGCLYAFEKEIRSVIHKELYTVSSPGGEQRSLDELDAVVKKRFPKIPVKTISVENDPARTVTFNLKNKVAVFLDPYSGTIKGTIDMEKECLAMILKIHRSLALGDPGKIITGTSCLIFLMMIISGIILWWPRNKAAAKHKFSIRGNVGIKRRLYDLHSVLGFYAAWILLFSALTGLIFAFKWFEAGMYALTGSKKEETKISSIPQAADKKASLTAILNTAAGTFHADRYFFALPNEPEGSIKVNVEYEKTGLLVKMHQLYFDTHSGRLLAVKNADAFSTGEKIRMNNYNIHTGRVLGITGEFIVFFAGLIAASLPVTGFMMWRSKRKRSVPLTSSLIAAP